MSQRARISLSGTDPAKVDGVCTQIKGISQKTGVAIRGPVPLPTKKLRVPCRKSPDGEGSETWDRWEMRIHKRLIDLDADELDRISKAITNRFGGARMSTVSSTLVREFGGELAMRADFVDSLLTSLRENQPRDRRMVELSGATNMLEFPEYSDVNKAKTFLATVEQRDSMYRMLKKASSMEFTVTIGSENEQEGFQDCSVVTASYRVNGTPVGSFGVIGPTRMDYARVLSILKNVQTNLGTVLQSFLKEE